MLIKIRRGWEIPEREATPEQVYLDRRAFLGTLGAGSLGAAGLFVAGAELCFSEQQASLKGASPLPTADLYPARRNPKYVLDRPITRESVAGRFNNFYEFTTTKDQVWKLAEGFKSRPWEVEVTGLVEKPLRLDVDELIRKMPLEERLYRLRCVEAWAMAVPWTGFPFKALIDFVKPLSKAKYVRMVSFLRPDEAPGQKEYRWYPFPYFEALSLEEASNELTLLVTGIYGHSLPNQHGAPIRLITPWKYGLKSIKSIVRFEFTARRPPTFWNTAGPSEYSFHSNVEPQVPHPRWSQARERLIDTGEWRETLLYNGYAEYVAHLYA